MEEIKMLSIMAVVELKNIDEKSFVKEVCLIYEENLVKIVVSSSSFEEKSKLILDEEMKLFGVINE